MRKYPTIWKLRDLHYHCAHGPQSSDGQRGYVPARPEGWPSFWQRVKCAWLVFNGRADAVIWPQEQ